MGANLYTLRAKTGLSQDELTTKLGFILQTVSAIENDKRTRNGVHLLR